MTRGVTLSAPSEVEGVSEADEATIGARASKATPKWSWHHLRSATTEVATERPRPALVARDEATRHRTNSARMVGDTLYATGDLGTKVLEREEHTPRPAESGGRLDAQVLE